MSCNLRSLLAAYAGLWTFPGLRMSRRTSRTWTRGWSCAAGSRRRSSTCSRSRTDAMSPGALAVPTPSRGGPNRDTWHRSVMPHLPPADGPRGSSSSGSNGAAAPSRWFYGICERSSQVRLRWPPREQPHASPRGRVRRAGASAGHGRASDSHRAALRGGSGPTRRSGCHGVRVAGRTGHCANRSDCVGLRRRA
jgi:hypothetical protein